MAQAVQSTLTELAEDAGDQVGGIQRRRKLSVTTLALPDELAAAFPGCGGAKGVGIA